MPGLPRDIQTFLQEYPGLQDDGGRDNLAFYKNELRCRPDNLLIDELHRQWWGKYDTLKSKHGFIQWLFPIREHGMNWESQPLQSGELEQMKGLDQVRQRLVRSYRLMLDFYGIELVDETTGELARSKDYKRQFSNLATSSHNYLRIRRILKCLGEFGLGQHHASFILFILNQQSQHGELAGSLKGSLVRFWVHCSRNEPERIALGSIAKEVYGGHVISDEAYQQCLQARQAGKPPSEWLV